jgi:hypothetical protein
MSDMLDVIHFFLEEDSTNVSTAEQAEAKDAIRVSIYRTMYGMEYKYASSKSNNNHLSNLDEPFGDDDDMPVPVDPFAKSNAVKPFVPATDFNPDAAKPFGRALDAPLG